MKRVLMTLLAAALVGGAIAGSAQAAPKDPVRVWERACSSAGGEISPQPALVCVHHGSPIWSEDHPGGLVKLQHVCEGALGGEFVYRSEYPTELAGCFFS
jgi:hypothetical protein